MRLVSYRHRGSEHYGAVRGDSIIALDRRLPRFPTVRALIAGDGLAAARTALEGAAPTLKLSEVTLLPPVVEPQKILCIGVNYRDRNEEYKDNTAQGQYPSMFYRAPVTVVGHGVPIERPKVSTQLDYEGEIALVIGKEGRHIAKDKWLDHVFGATLCNEGSVRDWLRHGKFNVTQGKNFDRSGSIGPWIVTKDEVDLTKPLTLTTRVNGEVRQHDTTARLIFDFPFLLSYVSTFMTLVPGDIIVTGTPTGAGARFDPPRWLKAGDVVEVEVAEIGTLTNRVVDEA